MGLGQPLKNKIYICLVMKQESLVLRQEGIHENIPPPLRRKTFLAHDIFHKAFLALNSLRSALFERIYTTPFKKEQK